MMQHSAAESGANGEFRSKFFNGLLRDCYAFQEHNTDFLRFGVGSVLSIDDLVGREALAKVDFIKMDIESAELKALEGAEGTLRAFRPTLAISLYHRDDDFVTIPDYLDRLGQGYEFFLDLDHFTIHRKETVLFARPKPEQG